MELELPAGFPPRRLHELRPPGYAVVGSLLRKNRLVVPRGGDTLKPKDQVLIFCTRADEERIRRYFLDVETHRREVGVE
jgi:Trk K+ transport system NAD-binding subunit